MTMAQGIEHRFDGMVPHVWEKLKLPGARRVPAVAGRTARLTEDALPQSRTAVAPARASAETTHTGAANEFYFCGASSFNRRTHTLR